MALGAGKAVEVRTFTGRVDLPKQVELGFNAGGVLVNLPASEGQKVAKGQLIAQLRVDEFQARLDAVHGQLDQARAALSALRKGERPDERLQHEAQERVTGLILANTRKEFDRYSKLVGPGYVSRSQYELAETNFLVAQEEHNAALQQLAKGTTTLQEDVEAEEGIVRQLSGQVAEAKIQLEDTALRAPFDGVVAQRLVYKGQSIAVNEPVIRLQSIDAIDIVVNEPGTIKESDVCSPSIVAMIAEISGSPGRLYPVHVKDVSRVADGGSQGLPVRFEMKPPFGVVFLPGMTATVKVRYRAVSRAAPVPSSSPCKQGPS